MKPSQWGQIRPSFLRITTRTSGPHLAKEGPLAASRVCERAQRKAEDPLLITSSAEAASRRIPYPREMLHTLPPLAAVLVTATAGGAKQSSPAPVRTRAVEAKGAVNRRLGKSVHSGRGAPGAKGVNRSLQS